MEPTRPVAKEAIAADRAWTTVDLQARLEQVTEQPWEDFFRAHVYGKELPPAGDD